MPRWAWLLLLLLFFIGGCTLGRGGLDNGGNGGDPGGTEAYDTVKNLSGAGAFYRPRAVPEGLRDWVNNAARHLSLGTSRKEGERLYILVTDGPRPTGGYTVEITDVLPGPEQITVRARFAAPAPGAAVTQAVTYPRDLVFIPDPGLPVRFEAYGAREYLMALEGTDTLEPITASSPWVHLFEPSAGHTAAGVLTVRGVASVFEGTLNYRLRDGEGGILLEDYTMAGMGDWYYFREDIPLAGLIPSGAGSREALLELFTLSAKDGSEEMAITLPVILQAD